MIVFGWHVSVVTTGIREIPWQRLLNKSRRERQHLWVSLHGTSKHCCSFWFFSWYDILFCFLPQARGDSYRPASSLSAPVTRFDGRPRARDRPKPRRRPRPKEPEETRRSRSAPATGAPTTPQPPSHTAHNEGFLYRKKASSSDLEAQQRSPNRYNQCQDQSDVDMSWSLEICLPKCKEDKKCICINMWFEC